MYAIERIPRDRADASPLALATFAYGSMLVAYL